MRPGKCYSTSLEFLEFRSRATGDKRICRQFFSDIIVNRNTFSMKMCFFGQERMQKKRFECDEDSGLVSFRQLRRADL